MYDEAEAKKRGVAYKYGLVIPFLRKFPFEDQEQVPNSVFYTSDDDEEDWQPNAHQLVKRFLKQVRESNGYDVDCYPPPRFNSPFIPKDPINSDDFFIDAMMKATRFAINKINAETGKTYELVQVDKVIHTSNSMLFLTFTVKEADADDGSPKTIRAMVDVPYCKDGNFTLVEWMFKPLPPAAEESREDVYLERGGEVASNLERLSSAENSIMGHIFSMLDNKSAINLSLSCKSCCSAWASLKKPSV